MEITVTRNKGPVPLTMMALHGSLDGSNYTQVVAEAERLYKEGERNLLLDLSDLGYMSSAGIVALHRVARLFRGQGYLAHEEGWSAYRSARRDQYDGPQAHVKLIGLHDQVQATLELTGFNRLFEVYDGIPQAVASFRGGMTDGSDSPMTYQSR